MKKDEMSETWYEWEQLQMYVKLWLVKGPWDM